MLSTTGLTGLGCAVHETVIVTCLYDSVPAVEPSGKQLDLIHDGVSRASRRRPSTTRPGSRNRRWGWCRWSDRSVDQVVVQPPHLLELVLRELERGVALLSPEETCCAWTNTGTIAANAMPAMMMVTSNSTKLKPASRCTGPPEVPAHVPCLRIAGSLSSRCIGGERGSMSPLVLIRCPAGRAPIGSRAAAPSSRPCRLRGAGQETRRSLCHLSDRDESSGARVRRKARLVARTGDGIKGRGAGRFWRPARRPWDPHGCLFRRQREV